MARPVSGSLTRIGFRRDVKLFLAALVGYLIVMILALLLILQNSVITNQQSAEAAWSTVAETMVRDLDRIESLDRAAIERRLRFYRENFEILSAELEVSEGDPIRSGYSVEEGREIRIGTRHGHLRVLFDDSLVRHDQRRFNWIAIIVIVGTLGVTIVLVLYLPKIVRPIEEMLDHAEEVEGRAADADEAHFLVETFKRSVETLKRQKEELARLHSDEKTRADDLERVTSTLKRSIASGFIAVDAEGRVVEINSVAERLLGIEASPGDRLEAVLPNGRFADDLARCVEEHASLTRHETVHPGPGGDISIGLTTVPLRGESDEIIGMIAIFTDLTPIRSLEARVRDLQTLADLGEISAGIAHEFRNSLATVLGYLRLAHREERPGESRVKLEAAEREAKLLSEAVSKLLSFSRPIEPEFRHVDLKSVAADVVSKLATETEGIDVTLEGESTPVRGDATLLRVVVENLVRNAVEAVSEIDEEKRIRVETTRGTRGLLTVTDNGPGIESDELARFFLPFQSGRPGGFGLGLALSRKIVLLHEGDISLTRDEGETVARVELPGV